MTNLLRAALLFFVARAMKCESVGHISIRASGSSPSAHLEARPLARRVVLVFLNNRFKTLVGFVFIFSL